MVDTTGWTARSKSNPYFAEQNHVKLTKKEATKPLVNHPVDGGS